ncbi:MAG: DoxX family membrane protein [Patescibacteria group bacterium]|mgnify:CR=1 FL=1
MLFPQKLFLFLLRISIGLLFFYAGISKVLNPAWSAAGYLTHAKTFAGFYAWLASPALLPFINFLNEWGLTLLGVALLLGLFVRLSGILGAVLMLFYYFPALKFPYVPPNAFLADEHIIYIFALLVLVVFNAGNTWGMGLWLKECGKKKGEEIKPQCHDGI